MNLVRTTAAITIPLILAVLPRGSLRRKVPPGPGFAQALLALMSFAMVLTGNIPWDFFSSSCRCSGFPAGGSLLMADSAIILLAMARPGHVSPTLWSPVGLHVARCGALPCSL